ncbi:43386_t:CDS:1, partial [Gigaspora margarita]
MTAYDIEDSKLQEEWNKALDMYNFDSLCNQADILAKLFNDPTDSPTHRGKAYFIMGRFDDEEVLSKLNDET